MVNHEIRVDIGEQSYGATAVPHDPSRINLVRVKEPHGHPHVLPSATPGESIIEVLGAVPDSQVTVTFCVEEE